MEVIGLPMIVKKKSWGDIYGDKHVDGVMFMRRQNEEDTKNIKDPSEVVQTMEATRSVLRNEEIEHGYHGSVTTEHIISASSYASKSHT